MLIVALLLSRDRGSVQPSAATPGPAPPPAAASTLSVVDEPPGVPTYPIPPEVIAALRARQISIGADRVRYRAGERRQTRNGAPQPRARSRANSQGRPCSARRIACRQHARDSARLPPATGAVGRGRDRRTTRRRPRHRRARPLPRPGNVFRLSMINRASGSSNERSRLGFTDSSVHRLKGVVMKNPVGSNPRKMSVAVRRVQQLSIGMFIVMVLAPRVVLASDSTVEVQSAGASGAKLSDEGFDLYRARDYRRAAEKFLQAYTLSQDSNLLFNIARCYEALGDPEAAIEKYEDFLSTPDADVQGKRRATQAIRELRQSKSASVPVTSLTCPFRPRVPMPSLLQSGEAVPPDRPARAATPS